MHESISNTVLRRAEKNRKEIQEYNENNIKKEKNDINIVIEKEKDNEINGPNPQSPIPNPQSPIPMGLSELY